MRRILVLGFKGTAGARLIENSIKRNFVIFSPLNTKLNHTCHLLALLGAHHIMHISRIHSLVFSLEGRAWQEPEPSHVTGMALAHCSLGKFLGVVCHAFPRV